MRNVSLGLNKREEQLQIWWTIIIHFVLVMVFLLLFWKFGKNARLKALHKFATVMNDDDLVLTELTEITLEGNRQTHCSFDPLMFLPARSFMGKGKDLS